ncbi:MAG: hypothetical protein AAFZ11_07910 [Pseudomonadota bacterium]
MNATAAWGLCAADLIWPGALCSQDAPAPDPIAPVTIDETALSGLDLARRETKSSLKAPFRIERAALAIQHLLGDSFVLPTGFVGTWSVEGRNGLRILEVVAKEL